MLLYKRCYDCLNLGATIQLHYAANLEMRFTRKLHFENLNLSLSVYFELQDTRFYICFITKTKDHINGNICN